MTLVHIVRYSNSPPNNYNILINDKSVLWIFMLYRSVHFEIMFLFFGGDIFLALFHEFLRWSHKFLHADSNRLSGPFGQNLANRIPFTARNLILNYMFCRNFFNYSNSFPAIIRIYLTIQVFCALAHHVYVVEFCSFQPPPKNGFLGVCLFRFFS